METHAYPVKLRRVGPTLPYFDSSYEYSGRHLPFVGDTVLLRRTGDLKELVQEDVYGYVTRIEPTAATPICATETSRPAPPEDDYLVA